MELLEYIQYNYAQKNELIVQKLEELIKKNKESLINELESDIYLILGLAKGFTEYKTKELATILGISKTAVKYMINTLIAENKIELIKENNITFIKIVY